MNKPIVFMFSGQGSQYYHMGRELFTEHPIFQKWMLKLDNIVCELIGESILNHLYDEQKRRDVRFDRVLYTHPAVFMVEYSLARVLLESGIEPQYVFGASLGEFVSVTVAGMMPVEEVLECVVRQAQAFEDRCPRGGMLAIIHSCELFDENPRIFQNCELVGINFHSHFVVAGTNEELKQVELFLKEKHILHQVLPVSFGFHSPLIDPAATVYKEFIKNKVFCAPQKPIVSCWAGKVVEEVPRDYFWLIARRPLRFVEALERLESTGSFVYLDLGPSGTLANFTKYNLKTSSASETLAVMTPFINQEMRNLKKVETLLFPK